MHVANVSRMVHVIGDAADAYPADLGLERFQRHLLFLKPDVLIVADDIRLKQPQELELRFHPEQQNGRPDGAGFLFEGKSAVLRLEPLTAESVRVDADRWQNVVALSWAAAGQPVKQVKIERQVTVTTFRSGDRAVSLDWSTSPAKLGPANE